MKRFISVVTAVLLAVSAGAALAEESWDSEEPYSVEAPAGACAHEHTETSYYFDYPVYSPVDSESHAVSGPATVTVVCLDCGAVLSVTAEDNALEIHPHVFRGGRCALCGWEDASRKEPAAAAEEVISPSDSAPDPEQNFVTLTGRDLEQAGDVLVLRTGDRNAALVVRTQPIREEVERSGGFMTAEIVRQDDRHISTSVRLYDASGAESVPGGQLVSLRVYTGNPGTPVAVSYTGPDGNTFAGEAGWVEGDGGENYWNIPWLGNGLYELIQ